jgi:hypothetical protein
MASIPRPETFGLCFPLASLSFIFPAFTLHNSDLVPALIYHIGRVMRPIATARDLNNYGTLVDQTDGSGTAREPAQWGVAAWNFCLAIILLGTHENYRLRLEAIVPKGTINLPKFRHLVRNLLSEWAGKQPFYSFARRFSASFCLPC